MTAVAESTPSPWSITTRVIVYAAIGAAILGVLNSLTYGIGIPGTEIQVRPHYGLLTFFGFAFGPIVGFVVGFLGGVIGDTITGWGAFTSWHWSVANGLVGLIAGLFPIWMASRMTSASSKAVVSAVASAVAVVVGFLFIFIELIIQPELGFEYILTVEYIPTVIANVIAAVIVTPILVLAWEPISAQMGR